MITAIDTSVLLDLLAPGSTHGDESERLVGRALGDGLTFISDIVYAELAAGFPTLAELDGFLLRVGVERIAPTATALHLGGRAWREYLTRRPGTLVCASCGAPKHVSCDRCGAAIVPRQHVLADFLIGAHAMVHAERLLTRDRGFYRSYFADLRLMESGT